MSASDKSKGFYPSGWWLGITTLADAAGATTTPGTFPALLKQTVWIAEMPSPPAKATKDGSPAVMPVTLTAKALSHEEMRGLVGKVDSGASPQTLLEAVGQALEPAGEVAEVLGYVTDPDPAAKAGLVLLPSAPLHAALGDVGLAFDAIKMVTALEAGVRVRTTLSLADAALACGRLVVNVSEAFGHPLHYLAYVVGFGGYVVKIWKEVQPSARPALFVTPPRPITLTPLRSDAKGTAATHIPFPGVPVSDLPTVITPDVLEKAIAGYLRRRNGCS